jgi:ribosomal protein S18 acetylase RimI-like enzyme
MTTSVVSGTNTVDVDRTVAVIALAFVADPIARWAYPDPQQFWTYFPPLVRAFGGRAFETATAFVAGDYAGAALWLPPGEHPDEEAMGEIFAASVSGEREESLSEFGRQQSDAHPTQPHWYLPLIGVDPAHQGQGHGSRLMQHALRVCDRDGLPAYLEATSLGSRALYRRHGFEAVGEIQAPGSPPMWPMWREPR